jgi:hypothetical protein
VLADERDHAHAPEIVYSDPALLEHRHGIVPLSTRSGTSVSRIVADAAESDLEPSPRETGGGLGLPLIDMLADRVEVAPRDPGTSVTFELR